MLGGAFKHQQRMPGLDVRQPNLCSISKCEVRETCNPAGTCHLARGRGPFMSLVRTRRASVRALLGSGAVAT